MEGHRRVVCGATQVIGLLAFIFLFYTQSFSFDPINFLLRKQNSLNWNETMEEAGVFEENLQSSFKSLLSDDDLHTLETTGLACNSETGPSLCVTTNPVKIDTATMEIYLPTQPDSPNPNRNFSVKNEDGKIIQLIRPYAWHQLDILKTITPVKFLREPPPQQTPPISCDFHHKVPALVFSSGVFPGNVFHEFNEIIIPLYLTSRSFRSRIQFILVDFNPNFVNKFNRILSTLSDFEVLNPNSNTNFTNSNTNFTKSSSNFTNSNTNFTNSNTNFTNFTNSNTIVRCFHGSIVGLKFHSFLSIKSSEIPKNNSMIEFKKFLQKTYDLKIENASISISKPPILILISRRKTRRFLNEDEIVEMMEELGFEVVVVKSSKTMSDLDRFSKLLHTCEVLVGAHGAGLTNQVFLPPSAVVVQVVPLGLEWPSAVYFGEPAVRMGFRYLEYRVGPEESSLVEKYARADPVISDPGSVFAKGYFVGKEVYLDRQDVRVDVGRFRSTMIEALRLIGRTTPLST